MILLLSFLFWTLPGASADTLPTAQDFCRDPYPAVCGASGEVVAEQVARLHAAAAHGRAAANEAVAARYHYTPADDQGYNAYLAAHPELSAAMTEEFVRAIRADVRQAAAFDLSERQEEYARVRRELEGVLGAALAPTERSRFLGELAQATLRDGGEILTDPNADPVLLSRAIFQCRTNGLADNAFQPPGTHFVVLCPGLLIASRADAEPTHLYPFLAWTMAHESGHVMDSSVFPETYAAFRGCIETEFPDFSPTGFPATLTPEERLARMDSYMEEMSADLWGAETLARMASETPGPAEAWTLVRDAAQTLCGTHDDGKRHPSDRFRIEILLGRNPRVRRALGCGPPAAEMAGCALEGRVRD